MIHIVRMLTLKSSHDVGLEWPLPLKGGAQDPNFRSANLLVVTITNKYATFYSKSYI